MLLYVYCVCVCVQDDPEDLCFKKGDKMTILRKDEEEWWFARHEDGRSGAIPVPYVNVVSGRTCADTCTHTHTHSCIVHVHIFEEEPDLNKHRSRSHIGDN